MPIKPTPEQARIRLRLDDDLDADLQDAIDQSHAEAVKYLDGKLYADEGALQAAQDPKGIVVGADIINAQLLLVDCAVGANGLKERESKRAAAFSILRQHRNQGA